MRSYAARKSHPRTLTKRIGGRSLDDSLRRSASTIDLAVTLRATTGELPLKLSELFESHFGLESKNDVVGFGVGVD
jgi:hypothetical protein